MSCIINLHLPPVFAIYSFCTIFLHFSINIYKKLILSGKDVVWIGDLQCDCIIHFTL